MINKVATTSGEFRNFIGLLIVTALLLYSTAVYAQYHFDLTPAVSVSEEHDDNIFLDNVNEQSDYITEVSPSITIGLQTRHTNLDLRYAPTFVWYDEYDENDTTRHLGTLVLEQDLFEHVRFNFSDTYLKSEDPLESSEDVEGVRQTRNTYQRNTGSASLRFLLGRENELNLGYRNSYLENEDRELNDGLVHNPFGSVQFWFNVKNGVEVKYDYIDVSLERDDGLNSADDYNGHSAGGRYIYRFTQHSNASLGYNFTSREFDGLTENYEVHEGSLGFWHQFSSDFSATVNGGYFVQDNDRSDNEDGYIFDASIVKRFQKGRVAFGGQGGWYESVLDVERRGFRRYASGNARIEYQILEPLNLYLSGLYRLDKQQGGREWERLSGNCGLKWTFLRWFSLSLNYSYAERDDDVDTEDYKVNRIMVTLSGSKLFRW